MLLYISLRKLIKTNRPRRPTYFNLACAMSCSVFCCNKYVYTTNNINITIILETFPTNLVPTHRRTWHYKIMVDLKYGTELGKKIYTAENIRWNNADHFCVGSFLETIFATSY